MQKRKNYHKCSKIVTCLIHDKMWMSPGQCERFGMYAKKQHLVLKFVFKIKR